MIVKVLLILLSLYSLIALFFYWNQRSFIYFPFDVLPSPAQAGVPEMQVVTLQTEDGLKLTAWYRAPTQPGLPTMIYFPGNAGHIGYRGPLVKPFLDEGYGVLLVTYRGYSTNPGTPSEAGLYQDARAAISFLQQHGVSDSYLVLYGESIGTGVAIQIATEYPVAALILQVPFTSLGAVGQFHYSFLPVKWLLRDQFNSLEKVKKIRSPTLVLHSTHDTIIPIEITKELYEALPSPKEIVSVPNSGHNDLFDASYSITFIQKYVHCP